jgi:hypothetical protein
MNIWEENKVYTLHGRPHVLNNDYNSNINSFIFNSYQQPSFEGISSLPTFCFNFWEHF